MPHLSRYKLSPDQLAHLSERLVTTVLLLPNRNGLRSFFADLLSPTEQAMIGKRLMIMLLLKKGYSFMDISSLLKVSQGTISSMSERLQRGSRDLGFVLDKLERREDFDKLIVRLGHSFSNTINRLPKKNGPRWRFFHQ